MGKGRRSPDPEGSGDLEDGISLLTRPFSLAIIFLLAFAIILTVLLWKEGRFDKAIDEMTPKVTKPKVDWMGSRKAQSPDYQPQALEELPAQSDMDRALERAKGPPSSPPEVEGGE